MALGSSHRARGYTARSHNHRVGVGSLPERLGFTSHLLWLLLLMEHVLMVKAALSPQPRRETCRSLAFVKSPAEGFTVCQRPRHPHGEAQEGASQSPVSICDQPGPTDSVLQTCEERKQNGQEPHHCDSRGNLCQKQCSGHCKRALSGASWETSCVSLVTAAGAGPALEGAEEGWA